MIALFSIMIEIKKKSVKEYFDKIKPCLINIIINLQKSDTWKIQLTTAIKCISFRDFDEECVIHSKIDNIEYMPYDNGNEDVYDLFEALPSRCEIGLETSIRGSDFFSIQFNCCIINVAR